VLDLLLDSLRGLMSVVAIVLLALLAAVNLIGLTFVAYGWLMDADIHVKGGAVTLGIGAVTLVLCLLGIRALLLLRAGSAP
jgi:hypothetical protein